RFLVAVGVAVAVEGVIDLVLVTLTVRMRHRGTFIETLSGLIRLLVVTVPLFAPLVAVLAYAYMELSPWTVLFFIAPMLAAHKLVALYQEQRRLADRLTAANHELEQANLSFASALVATLDARDRYTAGHAAAVAIYARDIAMRLSLPPGTQDTAHLAGLLHDIGKVGLPAGILEKEGPLTPNERCQMEQHAVIGARILENVAAYADIALFVRHHHERYDGAGYPDGIRGNDIPIIARIIGVADAYNAMTSGRPYRQALSTEVARARLRAAAGSQFDPDVVDAFESILDDAPAPYQCAARADFSVEAQRHPALTPVPDVVAA
ncbi:MAG: HD-GYP domain-containing protein, partial [Actinomycetota bacterium]|nr:HD-GYP domain-containing protein [Actinomycetota bacterium]